MQYEKNFTLIFLKITFNGVIILLIKKMKQNLFNTLNEC